MRDDKAAKQEEKVDGKLEMRRVEIFAKLQMAEENAKSCYSSQSIQRGKVFGMLHVPTSP
jgi:hypothetical protein